MYLRKGGHRAVYDWAGRRCVDVTRVSIRRGRAPIVRGSDDRVPIARGCVRIRGHARGVRDHVRRHVRHHVPRHVRRDVSGDLEGLGRRVARARGRRPCTGIRLRFYRGTSLIRNSPPPLRPPKGSSHFPTVGS